MSHLVLSLCVGDRPVRRSGSSFPTCVPDVVLIQLTLLMTSTRLPETCIEFKQKYIKGIVRQIGLFIGTYIQNCNRLSLRFLCWERKQNKVTQIIKLPSKVQTAPSTDRVL